MLKSEKYPHPLSQANFTQLNDDEGGLNLGQVGAVLRRRLLLIGGTTALVATAAVLKAETDPPVYQGTFDILTKPVTGEDKVISNVPQTINSQDRVAPPESTREIQTTITVLQSPRVLNPIVEKLQAQYPDLTYDTLIYYLTISSSKPNILNVGYTNSDPTLVSDVLRLLADAYLQYSLQERQSEVEVAIQFVDQQKKPLEKSLKYWQEQLRNLRLDNNLIEPAQKAQELSSQISTMRQQRIENRVQLEQMVATYEELQRELAQQPGERAGNSLLGISSTTW